MHSAGRRQEGNMRLDKYISQTGTASRKECARAARAGLILVDGIAVRDVSAHIDENSAEVVFCGKTVRWSQFTYVMLHKPAGVICTTEDTPRSVMRLLPPEFSRRGMFPCGRLDVDTVGLLLITNDGPLAHVLLSPKHHVEKVYIYMCDPPITSQQLERLEAGVDIDGYFTKPARVEEESSCRGRITVTEGKYHQIKRMFAAVGSKIVFLKREQFGPLVLDPTLTEGTWRYLTDAEILALVRLKKNL